VAFRNTFAKHRLDLFPALDNQLALLREAVSTTIESAQAEFGIIIGRNKQYFCVGQVG